jgi:hypothetical protein
VPVVSVNPEADPPQPRAPVRPNRAEQGEEAKKRKRRRRSASPYEHGTDIKVGQGRGGQGSTARRTWHVGLYAKANTVSMMTDDDDDDVYYYIRWRLKLE